MFKKESEGNLGNRMNIRSMDTERTGKKLLKEPRNKTLI